MEHTAITRCDSIGRQRVLVGMCKTRCSERDVPYEHFYLAFPFNVETLEIVNGTNRSINMFDERPKVGTRIQGKKQRLISMPLQALSS